MIPEEMDFVPQNYAISWRNNWMLRQSGYMITYVTRFWGGAVICAEKANRKQKMVINIDK